jgi:hypothetical protein
MTNDPDQMVTLTTAATEYAANITVVVLADAGIEAKAFGGLTTVLPGVFGGAPSVFGVPVQVRLGDLEQAKAALTANKRDSVDIDWDLVEVGEREDQSPLTPVGHTPLAATIALWTAILVALAGVLLAVSLAFN